MDKATYIKMIKDKKIGGTEREVQILQVDLQKNNAMVKVLMDSKEMHFNSYFILTKSKKGMWQVISDVPIIEKI